MLKGILTLHFEVRTALGATCWFVLFPMFCRLIACQSGESPFLAGMAVGHGSFPASDTPIARSTDFGSPFRFSKAANGGSRRRQRSVESHLLGAVLRSCFISLFSTSSGSNINRCLIVKGGLQEGSLALAAFKRSHWRACTSVPVPFLSNNRRGPVVTCVLR